MIILFLANISQCNPNHIPMNFTALILQVDINEKIKNAPDSGYQLGIVIGSFLPFILLVGVAYWMYYRSKNRKDLD